LGVFVSTILFGGLVMKKKMISKSEDVSESQSISHNKLFFLGY